MTLRDRFAAAAITGLLAESKGPDPNILAQNAYQLADAMLAARKLPRP
jgi:hypothetical protein